MLGGGVFVNQNKVLPGTYINFMSAASVGDSSIRGVVAMPLEMKWGPELEVVKVTQQEFEKDSVSLFGYQKAAKEMLPLREMFRNAAMVYAYRLNSGGTKASNDHAEAKYSGERGNAILLVIQKNVEDESRFDVKTLIDMTVMDTQTVANASELEDNDFVVFKKDADLAESAGMALTGGTDGSVTGGAYQGFLDAVEQKKVNVIGCPTKDESTINLFTAYAKRMRDELGIKIQLVAYRASKADYEGVISVENRAAENEPGLVYWTAGAAASCAVNKSNTNKVYDGEYTVNAAYTQTQLSDGVKAGKFMFHQVGDEIRVLQDINTLVTFTEEKNRDFSDNQTVRVLDAVGNGVAALFAGRFMGQVPNDASGRISLWNEIVTFYKALAAQRAIEAVDSEQIVVEAGDSRRSVVVSVPIQPISCMDQLYMTVVIE